MASARSLRDTPPSPSHRFLWRPQDRPSTGALGKSSRLPGRVADTPPWPASRSSAHANRGRAGSADPLQESCPAQRASSGNLRSQTGPAPPGAAAQAAIARSKDAQDNGTSLSTSPGSAPFGRRLPRKRRQLVSNPLSARKLPAYLLKGCPFVLRETPEQSGRQGCRWLEFEERSPQVSHAGPRGAAQR